MENLEQLERRLWEAVDQLRANSKLTSTEYYLPVLGLIFLRHAYTRFLSVKAAIEPKLPKRGGIARAFRKDDFARKSALFLRDTLQYEVIQPDHGTVLDPGCGSGGVFVQTSHFLEAAGRARRTACPSYDPGRHYLKRTVRSSSMPTGSRRVSPRSIQKPPQFEPVG